MGSYFDLSYLIKTFPIILSYVHTSLLITFVAAVCGLALGSLVALIRINKLAVLDKLAAIYISFIRGTPFLVQLFLAYFGLPELMQKIGYQSIRDIPALFYVFLVFSLHAGAYIAEIIRSAILAVDKGQLEAAYSVGMSAIQAYIRIVLPQAFTIAIPTICNIIISTLKGTSLVFNVGVIDMMRKADLMGANSHRSLELYINVAIIYILLVFIISKLSTLIEKRQVAYAQTSQL
ncbi:amino acid ABC transporter permease|uniref:L-cystine transport system permease protein n=1 Tax=Dendrosporobacter quercicolus TaxID=146817 RepID=A0A1G9XG64_9FIRM|nr:amino acid ABC transporter permease [Dendrosporobacter quercicolus]NSL49675.1 amino acid ABC transporter permease [Dendrosporobacter quercicolus DSM 1736]SDM95738.1 L-cystine transport system permease protein [Dendrosporobacter quercicolus]